MKVKQLPVDPSGEGAATQHECSLAEVSIRTMGGPAYQCALLVTTGAGEESAFVMWKDRKRIARITMEGAITIAPGTSAEDVAAGAYMLFLGISPSMLANSGAAVPGMMRLPTKVYSSKS